MEFVIKSQLFMIKTVIVDKILKIEFFLCRLCKREKSKEGRFFI